MASKLFNKVSEGHRYNDKAFVPGAKCPNHGCRLHPTDTKGLGACEMSTAIFRYEYHEENEGFVQKEETVIQNRIVNGVVRPVRVKVQQLQKVKNK